MDKLWQSVFDTSLGARVYERVLECTQRHGMRDKLSGGVLLGLSGGADSVMLALVLSMMKEELIPDMKILAVHVNHMIRGDEADRDERFCKELCLRLDVEFLSVSVDVPMLARTMGKGVEETARDARYSTFENILRGRKDVSCVAVAHNATDNAETAIFNMVRGSGARGAAGIAPVRDYVIRPLIEISKADITEALDSVGFTYMTDSTNESTDYTRNYIRHEILPRLRTLNPSLEEAFLGLSSSLREDSGLIERLCRDELAMADSTELSRAWLTSLDPAILPRVIIRFAKYNGASELERKHVGAICQLLLRDNFRYSVRGSLDLVCERGVCRFVPKDRSISVIPEMPLEEGINKIPGFSGIICLGSGVLNSSSNVYKISIQANLSSAIIVGSLRVRSRADGDAYFYGGMTHKLKKVLNDRGIPPSRRSLIPIIVDDKGIVWVPGLGVRDDSPSSGEKNNLIISFSVPMIDDGVELFSALKET